MSYGIKYATAPHPGSVPRRIHPVQKVGDYFPHIMSTAAGLTAPGRPAAINPPANR
jgi:hypothetical protein